ncbi:MAG: hypothetical protein V1792_08745 [Pseudomonadota bacterium]
MRRFLLHVLLGTVLSVFAVMSASASAIDTHIKNLKDKDPEVRATAAYELGCG